MFPNGLWEEIDGRWSGRTEEEAMLPLCKCDFFKVLREAVKQVGKTLTLML